ncbi:unnamed protein product, partial [Ectocarpus sp. 4 AP-2014]
PRAGGRQAYIHVRAAAAFQPRKINPEKKPHNHSSVCWPCPTAVLNELYRIRTAAAESSPSYVVASSSRAMYVVAVSAEIHSSAQLRADRQSRHQEVGMHAHRGKYIICRMSYGRTHY